VSHTDCLLATASTINQSFAQLSIDFVLEPQAGGPGPGWPGQSISPRKFIPFQVLLYWQGVKNIQIIHKCSLQPDQTKKMEACPS
jgi:hypothetical protein